MSASCYAGSDRQFGPRVAVNCRNFDFTLLFEDAVLTILPAGVFVILFLARLEILRRNPVKVTSYRLAAYKVVSATFLVEQVRILIAGDDEDNRHF